MPQFARALNTLPPPPFSSFMAFSPPRAHSPNLHDIARHSIDSLHDDHDAEAMQMSELEAAQGPAGYRPLQREGLRSVSALFEPGDPHPPDSRKNPMMRTLYDLLEDPTSSSSAFLIHVFTTSLIILSAMITILETLPPFHATPSRVWFGLETALVVCFTVEYMCRAYAHSANLRVFWDWFGSFFAIVDLLAVVPYYIEIAIQADTTAFFRFSILRTFRLLRVFRPFKYSSTILLTIEVMYLSMKRSKDALFALGFFALVVLIVFSTLLYFAERGVWDDSLETFVDADGDPSQFASIPAAAWFVLVTMTTVGYGEMIPRSFLGRLFTLPLLIFGLLLIALPSFVLGREFSALWEGMTKRAGPRFSASAQPLQDSITRFINAHTTPPPHRAGAGSRSRPSMSSTIYDTPVQLPPPPRQSKRKHEKSKLSVDSVALDGIPEASGSSPPRANGKSIPNGDGPHLFDYDDEDENLHQTISYPPLSTALSISQTPSRDLTNRKLGKNQQVLSSQIEQLAGMMREMREEMRVLRERDERRGGEGR